MVQKLQKQLIAISFIFLLLVLKLKTCCLLYSCFGILLYFWKCNSRVKGPSQGTLAQLAQAGEGWFHSSTVMRQQSGSLLLITPNCTRFLLLICACSISGTLLLHSQKFATIWESGCQIQDHSHGFGHTSKMKNSFFPFFNFRVDPR